MEPHPSAAYVPGYGAEPSSHAITVLRSAGDTVAPWCLPEIFSMSGLPPLPRA